MLQRRLCGQRALPQYHWPRENSRRRLRPREQHYRQWQCGFGAQALASSTAAGYIAPGASASVAIGYRALTNATGTGQGPGDGNTAVGDRALEFNTDGAYNNAF